MKVSTSLRLASASALMMLLSACGGEDEGADLTTTRSDLSAAQIDSALGPTDQSAFQDAGAGPAPTNQAAGNEAAEINTTNETAGEEQQ